MKKILFLGEGSLEGPARYLAGILTWAGYSYDHCEDQEPIPSSWLKRSYDAVILSDYRHASFSKKSEGWLTQKVQQGAGLLMIGGWASFTGLVGHYAGSAIEKLLPVSCRVPDDRVNRVSVVSTSGYPVLCGYHRVRVKPNTQVKLWHRELKFFKNIPSLGKPQPLWVTGTVGKGRTAVFLTDCAPHWAGGLVDWGRKRIAVQVPKGGSVEVGERYLHFFSKLVSDVTRNATLRKI